MRPDFLSHPCSGRVRDVPVPDCERELKSLKISLKICPLLREKSRIYGPFFMEARVGIEQRLQSKLRIRLLEINGLRH